MDNRMCVVLTTMADRDEARRISKMLLEKNLAACTQEFDVNSRFRWKGVVQSEPEIVMLIKTAKGRVDATIEAIKQSHSYELPEIIVLPVTGGLPGYIDWVEAET
ncbi:MAG: divalent-cation tolerance protein CutA [Desulfobulbaceae bacterium]|nr:MAG: divalent-cation tolerance protein CutA [Desulfobulbaceae bacterium]